MVVRIENGECAEWMVAHEALSRLAKARAQAEFEEGKWLLCALHAATHVRLGFGSFAEYVERLFGYSPVVPSRYGNRYAYGHVVEARDDGPRHLIVSGGLGCSIAPLRFGVPPEILLVELGYDSATHPV